MVNGYKIQALVICYWLFAICYAGSDAIDGEQCAAVVPSVTNSLICSRRIDGTNRNSHLVLADQGYAGQSYEEFGRLS